MTVALDIGCGDNKAPGAIGVDVSVTPVVEVLGTANALPFRESSADIIYLSHVLEHVDSLVATIEEIWRVAKPGAFIHVWSPHFSCGLYVWSDPTHRRAFASTVFDYFDSAVPLAYYSHARFQVLKRELHFGFRRTLVPVRGRSHSAALIKGSIGRLFETLANRGRFSQILCERTWANWVGFEEVYFQLKVVKPA